MKGEISPELSKGISLEQITELRRFGNILLSLSTVESIVEKTFSKLKESISPQISSVFLFSKDGFIERYRIAGTDKNGCPIGDTWLQGERYRPGESFSGKAAFAQGQPYGEPHWSNSLDVELIKLSHGNDYWDKLGFLKCGISVPLNGTHRTFGTIEVINRINPKTRSADRNLLFSESDVCWLTIVGAHVAAAISRLRKKDEDKIFSRIIHVLADPRREDPLAHSAQESVYHLIAKSLVDELMPYKVCIVRLSLDGKSLSVTDKAHSDGDAAGWRHRVDEARVPGQGVVGKVFETGEYEIVKNIEDEEEKIIDKEWVKSQNLKSFICFPLLTLGKVIGTLSLFTGYVHEFTDSDIEFLGNVSSLLAAFIVRSEKVKNLDSFGNRAEKLKQLDSTNNELESSLIRLSEDLLDEKTEIRKRAALLLGEAGNLFAVPDLCRILTNDPSPEVRRSAAKALGMLKDKNKDIDGV